MMKNLWRKVLMLRGRRLALVCSLITVAISTLALFGTHTFVCLAGGFLWSYYLYFEDEPKAHVLFGRWKMSYHRYSFAKFVKNIDKKINQHLNPKGSQKIASLFRLLIPTLFFGILHSLLPLQVAWYFVLVGALVFEGTLINSEWLWR